MLSRRALSTAMIVIGMVVLLVIYLLRPPLPQVDYSAADENDSAIDVDLVFCLPTQDRSLVPETEIPQSFVPGTRLCFQGTVEREPNAPLLPIILSMYQDRHGKPPVICASGMGTPEEPSGEVQIFTNAPLEPGTYRLEAEWFGGGNFVARATVKVIADQGKRR
ncbi:hypothetical protein [Schlesneria sp. T3-172]|uniref:hypothetical protein n=1 Tax=Schlesneria sphaerica TaxID=3373610 RepID=UPI0037C91349